MALATTCPHCKTSFKVVADQLKLRRGLVRCGKCQEVFSGVDYLRYIDDPAPRASSPAPSSTKRPDPVRDPAAGEAYPARPSSPPAPAAAPGLDDLKTAFFLPETIFGGTTAHEAIEVQAPVPAYMPSPELPPGAAARPTGQTTPTPGPSSGTASEPGHADQTSGPLPAGQGPAEEGMDTDTWPSGAPVSEAPGTPVSDTETADATSGACADSAFERLAPAPEATSPGLPGQLAEAANEDALSGDFERAALRLSSLPEGMDLEPQRSRPGLSSAMSLHAAPVADLPEPANGAQFSAAPEDEDGEGGQARRQDQDQDQERLQADAAAGTAAGTAAARRRFPGAALAAGLLLVLALAQAVITARNELAVQFPMLKEPLAQWLQPLGLKVELPRRYDAVTIESFELQAGEAVAGEIQPYLAQALLRNQSSHPVQWPAIELSLTDPAGQLLARKVLLPADYLAGESRETGFAARSERTVRVRLGLNQITPNGYSAVLFYP